MMVQRVLLQKCYYLPAKGETRDQDLDSQNRGKLNFLFRLPGLDGSGDAVAAASLMPVCLFIVIVDCNCSRSTNTHTRRIHFQVQHFWTLNCLSSLHWTESTSNVQYQAEEKTAIATGALKSAHICISNQMVGIDYIKSMIYVLPFDSAFLSLILMCFLLINIANYCQF